MEKADSYQLRLIIDAAPNGMLIVNEFGQIVLVNSEVERLFGYSRDELLGQTIELLVPDGARALHPRYRAEFFANPAVRAMGAGRDLHGRRKDGELVPVEIGLNPLESDGQKFVVASVVDISKRKDQEANEKQIAVFEQREEFMATLTHDLKIPLIAANRILELMASGRMGEMSSEHEHLLLQLRDSNKTLLSMIQNLIEVYRLEKDVHAIHVENMDLLSLIKNVLRDLGTIAHFKNIEIETHLPETFESVRADRITIHRVMQNLLDNALKFTPEGGKVTVQLVRSNNGAFVEVADTGPGISDEDQKRLFQRFSQATPGRRYTPGTGLGLFLCKKIIEAHGGKITCASREGYGAAFRFWLPFGE